MENKKDDNKVKLKLDDYLKLYEFRKNFESDAAKVCKTQYNFHTPTPYNNGTFYNTTADVYVTENEAVTAVLEENKKLADRAEILNAQFTSLRDALTTANEEKRRLQIETIAKSGSQPSNKELTVQDIKNMSLWGMLRWRWKNS